MSAVRYSVAMMVRAQTMREAGWSLGRIRDLIAREFDCAPPSINTIWCWVEPDASDRQRAAKRSKDRRRRAERSTFAFPNRRGPEWKMGRMRALREAGVSFSAITKVMRVDFGDALTEDEVRGALSTGRPPRKLCTAGRTA